MHIQTVSRWLNILILLALLFAPLTTAASTQASVPFVASNPDFASDRLLARLQDGFSLEQAIQNSPGVLSAQPLFRGQSLPSALAQIVLLELLPGSDVRVIAESLSQASRFAWVEPDYLATGNLFPSPFSAKMGRGQGWGGLDATPNDPLYPDQWGLAKIEAPAAWDVQTGSETVVIAIVDSGIQRTHPDLQGRLWVNPGEVPDNNVDDDNNGLIDDVHGWDFVSEDNDPIDDNGHGTQVAGVAVAATNNGAGIAGACWSCRLMSVKVMSAGGVANYSDIAQGVLYAAQKGAKVINLSLGGYSYSNALLEAVQSAVDDYGTVVVAGAGNDNTDAPFYPAAYQAAIAVAGTDQSDLKASFSDFGDWVDLSAPSVAIYTTFSGGDYGPVDGTSMAAPFVSGVAGLLLSEHADWSGALIRAQLTHTADPLDALNPGYEGLLGSGRLNAGSALTVTPHPLLSVSGMLVNGDPLGRPDPGESSTLEITLGNDWLDAQAVQGVLSTSDPYVTITQDSAEFGDLPAGGSGTGTPAYTFDVASGAGYDHLINFTVTLSAYGGYSSTLNFTIKTRSAEEQIWGTIDEDTTWTNDKTYIVMGNIGIAPEVTLTIQPGTTVEFNGNYNLNVGGQLIADGTEDQPIRFIPKDGVTWGQIFFDDTSVDAMTDISGTYQSGTILRWLSIQGSGLGIGCMNATPYLSNIVSNGSGLNCRLGATQMWVFDSQFAGDVNISGDYPVMGQWFPRANMPTARNGLGAEVVNGRIYAIGGRDGYDNFLTTVEEYDPLSNTWMARTSMPTGRVGLAAITQNNLIYAIGGWIYEGYLPTVEVYDPSSDTWNTRTPMGTARSQFGVAALNNKVYAIGGPGLSTVEEYDPVTDSWVYKTSMPTPRYGLAVVVLEGLIYAIGGQHNGIFLPTVEIYDPATNSWTAGIDMPSPRSHLVAGVVNGKIYAIGGIGEYDYSSSVEEFDPHTSTWTTRADLSISRYDTAAVAYGDGIFVIGGKHSGPTDQVELFNPPTSARNSDISQTIISIGSMALPGDSSVYFCAIPNGSVSIDGNGVAHNLNIGQGGITVAGIGDVNNSAVNGAVSLGSGTVRNVSVNGGISVGIGEVLSNTITGGGISVGDGSVIQSNNIENSPSWGIQSGGSVTIQGNRLVGNASGIQASGGLIQDNLVASSAGVGLELNGDVSITDNTFNGNAGNTIVINSGTPTIQGNNLEGNTGAYDIQNLTANDLPADGNWWGTTEAFAISQRIYDYDDDYTLGEVVYLPMAENPIQTAPAYVRSVTVDPNPVGIETSTFDIIFSRPMDMEIMPELSFQSVLHDTWTVYNTSNSGLPSNQVFAIASDADGSHWFGTDGGGVTHFDGTTWTVYNTSNSGLPRDGVWAIAIDADGSLWFGTEGGGVAHFDDTTWTVYNSSNSELPNDHVVTIASNEDDSLWFGTFDSGVARFDGITWTVYNTSNSGLPNDEVAAIANDIDGSHWFGTLGGGVAHFDGMNWTVHDTSNSGLTHDYVSTIANDSDGIYWFGTWGGGVVRFDGVNWTAYNTSNSGLPANGLNIITNDVDDSLWFGTIEGGAAHFDGVNWEVYNTTNSGLPGNFVHAIASDLNGSHWFGTENGVGVLWNDSPHLIQDNPLWLDDTHYQASFDITSLIPRDNYRITVADAFGTDGIQIAPNTSSTFTVDYAGGVGDTTAPGIPSVTACAGSSMDTLSASWTASDPDSEITLYQYAIGTAPGASDVINWTFTDQTSFDLSGLTLTPGQLYYISVKARNAGGLWSEAATPEGVLPGSGLCTTNSYLAYLSLVSK